MNHNTFDAVTRILAASPTRRAALGALLGSGLAGAHGAAAARKDRARRRRRRKARRARNGKGAARVTAQAADCLSPGPSSNMSGCDFAGSDFSGANLSSSRMVRTDFRNAELVGTDLSSSNLKRANFRGADLTCADLSSSQLRRANLRGFAPSGRPTDLTGANLSSSGCAGLRTNQFTILCSTTWCDGSIRNDDCPGGPAVTCCGGSVCAPGQRCEDGTCVGCPAGQVALANGSCALACSDTGVCDAAGGSVCRHCHATDAGRVCTSSMSSGECPSGSSAECPPGSACEPNIGSPPGTCFQLCGLGPG